MQTTLEQFEVDLMRDMHPENEVLIWSSIAAAWMNYYKQNFDDKLQPDEDQMRLVSALIAISTGIRDVDKLGVPPDVGRKLLACYDALEEA